MKIGTHKEKFEIKDFHGQSIASNAQGQTLHHISSFGASATQIEKIETMIDVKIVIEGHTLKVIGNDRPESPKEVALAGKILSHILMENTVRYPVSNNKIIDQAKAGGAIKPVRKERMQQKEADRSTQGSFAQAANQNIPPEGRLLDSFAPRTPGQIAAWAMLEQRFDLNAIIAPAGTGKTYMLAAFALKLLEKPVEEGGLEKLFLSRPPVEAGEKIGYLPGGMEKKMEPYLEPLVDIIDKLIGEKQRKKYEKEGRIIVKPLGFLRGLTFENTGFILDEAQNSSVKSSGMDDDIKLVATRLGQGSWVGIAGDPEQTDLPDMKLSALPKFLEAMAINPEGFGLAYMTPEDNQRKEIVRRVLENYQTLRERHKLAVAENATSAATLLRQKMAVLNAYAKQAEKGRVDAAAEIAVEQIISEMSAEDKLALAAEKLGINLQTVADLPPSLG